MSSSLHSGPVAGPPVPGEWSRSPLELGLAEAGDGRWTGLAAGPRRWIGPAGPVREPLRGAGEDAAEQRPEEATAGWEPASEALDRLGLPLGAQGWRLVSSTGTLTRTSHQLSGAVRLGYRVVATEQAWCHEVVLPLPATGSTRTLPPGPGPLVGVSGWASAWVVDEQDALGLHWTTEQRTDRTLLGLRSEQQDGVLVVAPGVGSPEQPVPPRRDFSWRLVLTGWRRGPAPR